MSLTIMLKEQLYNEHLDVMFGPDNLDNLSEKQVDEIIERILSFLPNNGKLYKYRSIEGEAFEYAFDGLKQGYLYMARADSLNDDFDCSLNIDTKKNITKQIIMFKEKPWLFFEKWVKSDSNSPNWKDIIDSKVSKIIIGCINPITYELDMRMIFEILEEYGMNEEEIRCFIDLILQLTNITIKGLENTINIDQNGIMNYHFEGRKIIYIHSMTEEYDSDTMWAYYANGNKGFCIEYNYEKIRDLSYEKKEQLISIFRVIYKDEMDEYLVFSLNRPFFGAKEDTEINKKDNIEMLEHTYTKHANWKEEKEWRIILYNLDNNNKIFADIVSGIILDERILNNNNAKKLICLATERQWSIKIRRKAKNSTRHNYVEYIDRKNL